MDAVGKDQTRMNKRTLTHMRDGAYACFLLIGLSSLAISLIRVILERLAVRDLWLCCIAPTYVVAAVAGLAGLLMTIAVRRDPILFAMCCLTLALPILTVLEVDVPASVHSASRALQVFGCVGLPVRWFLVVRQRVHRPEPSIHL